MTTYNGEPIPSLGDLRHAHDEANRKDQEHASALAQAERAVIDASVAWRAAFGLDQDEWRCKRDLFAAIDSLLALTRPATPQGDTSTR